MYLNPNDYLQAICYRSNLMQHSLPPNVPVQQLLGQEQYASYLLDQVIVEYFIMLLWIRAGSY